uniref:Receptor protein serine/threonine kinase n=1 Tax=Opuntia streptacantha TaxID=393608 RepID=A0A7C9AJD2_OPUST
MIPNQLAELYSLEIFNVSYNSLTGRMPETEQFGAFDETSYYGNPRLCVLLVNKSCGSELPNVLPPLTNTAPNEDEDGDGGLDMEDFLWSFGVTSVVAFLATIAVLAINPQWRDAWFDFVEWRLLWWLL